VRREKGITLIELLVALAIVGAVFAVAATGLRTALNTELKRSARELSSLARYLRTKAVLERKYLRLVLSLDNAEYWVEESSEPFIISPEAEEMVVKKEKKEEGEEEKEETEFQEVDELLAKRRRLGSGVLFKDLFVSYLPGKREQGEGRVYFFPDGFSTGATINLKNEEDEDFFSIEVLPFSSKVSVVGEYREPQKK